MIFEQNTFTWFKTQKNQDVLSQTQDSVPIQPRTERHSSAGRGGTWEVGQQPEEGSGPWPLWERGHHPQPRPGTWSQLGDWRLPSRDSSCAKHLPPCGQCA